MPDDFEEAEFEEQEDEDPAAELLNGEKDNYECEDQEDEEDEEDEW